MQPEQPRVSSLESFFDTQDLDRLLEDCKKVNGASFWHQAGKEPRCGLESFAKEIFDHHTTINKRHFRKETSGAEWWSQCTILNDDQVIIHSLP